MLLIILCSTNKKRLNLIKFNLFLLPLCLNCTLKLYIMKSTVLIVLLFFSSFVFSQGPPLGSPIPIANSLDGNLFNYAQLTSRVRIDYARIVIPNKDIDMEGEVYAFKSWKTRSILHVNKSDIKLSNTNFNMRQNTHV